LLHVALRGCEPRHTHSAQICLGDIFDRAGIWIIVGQALRGAVAHVFGIVLPVDEC
jgi:hypothetical protein